MNSSGQNRFNLFKLGYIIFPFISFLLTLKHYRSSWFKNALWLFIIFFGFSMSFIETIDAYAYKEKFVNSARVYKEFNSFFDVFNPAVTGKVDFLVIFLNYILRPFTNNYHFLFGVYGVIFGYFYSRNIDFVLKQIRPNFSNKLMGIVLFTACFIGFWNINGFRFWTATHIFAYGLINFIYLNKRKKGITFLILPLAVHFSFVIPLLVFLIYKYIPSYKKLYLILIFLLSLYNPLSNLSIVQANLLKYTFNEQLERKVEVYTSEEILEKSQESSFNTSSLKIGIIFYQRALILILTFLLIIKQNKLSKRENLFLKYGIILSLVGAIISFIPSMQRFLNVGMFLMLVGISISLLNNSSLYYKSRSIISKLGYLATILIIPLYLWIIFTFSFHTLFGNYFTVLIDDSDMLYSIGNLLMKTYK
ncbi:EpsG family protein [Aequorivita sp. F47161]|uniref:EpsG family protein n=1 Tax=Aequorivita vitellina TaxID=2874475 RepID=A0A9X1U406_9FLAO|nr:EpsG family protein [Aequorivita vitellina]MCG2419777.1 EpsG family protein [Aequorivita vitellina]